MAGAAQNPAQEQAREQEAEHSQCPGLTRSCREPHHAAALEQSGESHPRDGSRSFPDSFKCWRPELQRSSVRWG